MRCSGFRMHPVFKTCYYNAIWCLFPTMLRQEIHWVQSMRKNVSVRRKSPTVTFKVFFLVFSCQVPTGNTHTFSGSAKHLVCAGRIEWKGAVAPSNFCVKVVNFVLFLICCVRNQQVAGSLQIGDRMGPTGEIEHCSDCDHKSTSDDMDSEDVTHFWIREHHLNHDVFSSSSPISKSPQLAQIS